MCSLNSNSSQGVEVKKIALLTGLFAALFAAVYGLMPFHDDWCYATAPNPDFTWSQLLPGASFWRPFDVLWGALMARMPGLFPNANRFVVILAHTLSSFFVWKALDKISKDRIACLSGTLFFAVSSVIAAVLFNSDTINQSWSFLLGIIALCVALEREDVSWYRWSVASGFVIFSMLFKESGVSWLAVIPLVFYWRERNLKFLLRRAAFGAGVLAFYFVVRFTLMGDVVVGGEYYELGFNFKKIIINFAMAVLLPLTQFDMLSFACGHWWLMAASAVACLAFWGCWIASAKREEMDSKVLLLIVLALAFAAPHCFFKGHHPAEMHFYPILFAGSVFVALTPAAAGQLRMRCLGVMAMLTLFVCGWYDKLIEVHKHSERTRALFQELSKRDIDFSKPVYFIAEADPNVKYYSVFTESAGHGLYWGKACRALNGWLDFDYHLAVTVEQRMSIPCGAQVIRIK